MLAYILRRLLLVIPTLLGIMVINFTLTQFVPGGPIQQIAAKIEDQRDGSAKGSGADAGAADQAQDETGREKARSLARRALLAGPLENRALLSTFTVTSVADSGGGRQDDRILGRR